MSQVLDDSVDLSNQLLNTLMGPLSSSVVAGNLSEDHVDLSEQLLKRFMDPVSSSVVAGNLLKDSGTPKMKPSPRTKSNGDSLVLATRKKRRKSYSSLEEQSNQSSKRRKKSFYFEYQIKSSMTYERADIFCKLFWHKSFMVVQTATDQLELQRSNGEVLYHLLGNKSLMYNQHNQNTLTIGDAGPASGQPTTTSSGIMIKDSLAAISKSSRNVPQNMSHAQEEKPYKCTQCPKMFSERNNLITHLRTHSVECPYCSKLFRNDNRLKKHISAFHVEVTHNSTIEEKYSWKEPYKCTECPQIFSQKSRLKLHQRIHSGEKPYKCTECPKMFSYEHLLKSHQGSHSREKARVTCPHCSKLFSDNHKLKTHISAYHIELTQNSTVCSSEPEKDTLGGKI